MARVAVSPRTLQAGFRDKRVYTGMPFPNNASVVVKRNICHGNELLRELVGHEIANVAEHDSDRYEPADIAP